VRSDDNDTDMLVEAGASVADTGEPGAGGQAQDGGDGTRAGVYTSVLSGLETDMKCEYCGITDKSEHGHCVHCGAPIKDAEYERRLKLQNELELCISSYITNTQIYTPVIVVGKDYD